MIYCKGINLVQEKVMKKIVSFFIFLFFIIGGLLLIGDDPKNELTNFQFLLVKIVGIVFASPGIFVFLRKKRQRTFPDYARIRQKN